MCIIEGPNLLKRPICWIFGHTKGRIETTVEYIDGTTDKKVMDWCDRCGKFNQDELCDFFDELIEEGEE